MRAGDEAFERLRTAIAELAAEEVSDLVAEARAEARSRVRSMLTEAMAQAMLERARVELEPEHPRPTAEPTGRPDAAPPQAARQPVPDRRPEVSGTAGAGLGWYVYCITRADGAALPELPGVDVAHPATPLREGELTAIVSRVPLAEFDDERLHEHLADMAWLERTARGHEAVIDAVHGLRTVIPMRLCTIYRDEVGVRAMLDREAVALTEALSVLEGRAEWGVKVFASPALPAVDPEGVATPDSAAAAGGLGRAYLEDRRRERQIRLLPQSREESACRAIHERLSAVAVDARLTAPQRAEVSGRRAEMVLNGVYLVEERRQEAFDETLSALQGEFRSAGFELEPTGPWPPYNFVPPTIGAPS